MTISVATERKIEALLAMGFSYPKIAAAVGVCRGTVGSVANGRRPKRSDERTDEKRVPILPPAGAAQRCRHCGRKVRQPCQACLFRIQQEHDAATATA
jgi:hypothetical protein